MNIKVWDDKYVIKSDSYCYILAEIKTKKAEDEIDDVDLQDNGDDTYEINIAYCNSFARCYEYMIEREGRKNKCTTLEGYVKHIEKISKQIDKDIQKLSELFGGKERLITAINKLP